MILINPTSVTLPFADSLLPDSLCNPCGCFYMSNTEEIWKDVPGYDGLYQISSFGRVKRLNGTVNNFHEDRILKTKYKKHGYAFVCLCKNGKLKYFHVHRLVGIAFIPNPENKPQINHKNGIKTDCNIKNLEWCTASENGLHSYRILNRKHIAKKGLETKASKQVMQMNFEGTSVYVWQSCSDASRYYGVSCTTIQKCCRGGYGTKSSIGYRWKFISNNEYMNLKSKFTIIPLRGISTRERKHF